MYIGDDMELLDWTYTRKYNIKAHFSKFPHSIVVFRSIKDYYFVYQVNWSDKDPVVLRDDLEEMELLLNRELNLEDGYLQRKSRCEKKC
jgi:diacylglycerol kinase (ATP)